MSYLSEELIGEAQNQRIKAGLSQRALAARSGLTQAHISQIETGRLEPGLSSFIQMARALDLEVVLVPKKLLPAVQGVLRQSSPAEAFLNQDQAALLARAERIVAKQRKLSGSSAALDRIAEYLRFFKLVRLAGTDLTLLSDVIGTLRDHQISAGPASTLDDMAGVLQGLRNRIVHPVEPPRPAYALDEDDDA